VWLLAGCLERVGQGRGGLRDCRIGRHEIGQAVARAGLVETLDRDVKSRPQLLRATSPGAGTQLVGWPRPLRSLHRTPGKPASSARACVARIASAASDNSRRRPRKSASGGASSCERIAPAHADCASLTAPQASSFVRAARASRRDSGTWLTPRSYRTQRQLRSGRGAAARTFRKNPSVAKNHRRTHTALLM
jgi:hypothetical protein